MGGVPPDSGETGGIGGWDWICGLPVSGWLSCAWLNPLFNSREAEAAPTWGWTSP